MEEAWRFADLRASGLSKTQIRRRADGGRWIRPYHGVYLDAALRADELARLRALFLRLPSEAVICRQTAARLHGFGEFAPMSRTVHVLLPAGVHRPRLRGVTIHETATPLEPVTLNGIPSTSAARCAVDLARTSRRLDALPVLDGALRAGCNPDDLAMEAISHGGLRGIRQVRELLQFADAGAQCRQESQLRLVVIDGGLPRPQPQLPVVDGFGRLRYVLDLGWEERRVGAEYDGVSHLDRTRARRDRERHNWLAAQGWRMRYFTDLDLYRRPRHVVDVLRDTLTG
ncbi:type IV toxin-antitoxin system AbiEi family antitoxin domain-containing protein [Polymorphospora sp. NPDC051019]|uniref:type IV toxin-antitoxin system AbiEi family antitoxin domain-containing protein n=1 Tax=Polymorphospora sp. NPDC051019 TaxID=3155725 RepID=UPI0034392379